MELINKDTGKYDYLCKLFAHLYDTADDMSHKITEWERAELKAFIDEQFIKVSKAGFQFEFVDNHPYKNFNHLYNSYWKGEAIKISTLNNESAIFDVETNLKFRAIHDVNHITCNADFLFEGEYSTFVCLSNQTSNQLIKDILFSEIVLQAASALENNSFLPQKLVILGDY